MRNARENRRSERAQDKQSRVKSQPPADLLSKSADSAGASRGDPRVDEPRAELPNDGQIQNVIAELVARADQRDAKGRFTTANTGHLGTLEHSEQLWRALQPLKGEMVTRVRVQLGADTDDAAETLLGVIDAYTEARLLRSSAFVRAVSIGRIRHDERRGACAAHHMGIGV